MNTSTITTSTGATLSPEDLDRLVQAEITRRETAKSDAIAQEKALREQGKTVVTQMVTDLLAVVPTKRFESGAIGIQQGGKHVVGGVTYTVSVLVRQTDTVPSRVTGI